MEFFDVVDKNRNKLNYKKARGESLQDNEYNMGAEMWIINNNKLLMTQRSVQKTHSCGWEVPGGCCQAGETTEDTIKREMKEEIGIKFEQDEFVLVGAQLYKKQFVDIFKTQKKINIRDIKLQLEEVQNVKFVGRDEFYKMIENDEMVLSVIQRYNLIKDKLELDW